MAWASPTLGDPLGSGSGSRHANSLEDSLWNRLGRVACESRRFQGRRPVAVRVAGPPIGAPDDGTAPGRPASIAAVCASPRGVGAPRLNQSRPRRAALTDHQQRRHPLSHRCLWPVASAPPPLCSSSIEASVHTLRGTRGVAFGGGPPPSYPRGVGARRAKPGDRGITERGLPLKTTAGAGSFRHTASSPVSESGVAPENAESPQERELGLGLQDPPNEAGVG